MSYTAPALALLQLINPATAKSAMPFFRAFASCKNYNYENPAMWFNKATLQVEVGARFLYSPNKYYDQVGTASHAQDLLWFY